MTPAPYSEPHSQNHKQARSLLAPPAGPAEGVKGTLRAIFWNESELRAGWRLVIFLVLFLLFAEGASLLTVFANLPQVSQGEIHASGLLVQEGSWMLAALGAAAILAMLEGRPFGAYGLPASIAFGARFWQGVLWGVLLIAGIILLIEISGGFSAGQLALHGGLLADYAALWGVVFLCVGFFEEFLFRGYAQFTLATGIGFWPAATVISAMFGAAHLANRGEGPAGALSVFVIGMFFCLTLRRTGNLWFAVGMHASFDWGETFLFSVPNSGIVAPGHLLNSSFHGPAWLTGGTVGPEGSVMTFALVALAAAIFVRVYPARNGQRFP